jgi:hypothetical protein
MTTSPPAIRRRLRRGALALAVSAICLPSGSALAQGDTKADYPGATHASPGYVVPKGGDTPADYPGTGHTTPVVSQAGDTPADYPGMPGAPVVVEPVVNPGPEAGGFDWTSAAVGAGGAGLLIVVALGAASGASRMRMRTVRS